jgi:hypothetical protein
MSGIDRDIIPDSRPSLIERHLPNTLQVQRLLRREGTHVFNDLETLERVTQAIIEGRERTGIDDDDDYERYGLYFSEVIGYIIRTSDASQTLLYYGEIKIVKTTDEYHAIPRTSPRRTS